MHVVYDRRLTRHSSLSDNALDPQLLRDNYSRLFPNDQRSRESVRGNITRTDGQVRGLESLDAIHVQARIDNATSRARLHRARTELEQSTLISAHDGIKGDVSKD